MRQFYCVSRRAVWAWLWLLPWWAIASPPEDPSPSSNGKAGDPLTAVIQYSAPSRTEPRPLQMHVLRIDLRATGLELAAAVGDDPDGDGPAEAQLTSPRVMATRAGFAAAVNTNPWVMVPATLHGHRTPYVAGAGCDISGWAVCDGRQRSAPQAGHWAFWLDDQRRAQLDAQPKNGSAQQAVAGFGGLIRRGEILPAPSDVLHPRTALGVDAEGRWLALAVVDGRQKGYSEGMSERELAEFMAELGCATRSTWTAAAAASCCWRTRPETWKSRTARPTRWVHGRSRSCWASGGGSRFSTKGKAALRWHQEAIAGADHIPGPREITSPRQPLVLKSVSNRPSSRRENVNAYRFRRWPQIHVPVMSASVAMIDSSVNLAKPGSVKSRARFSRRHRVIVAESGSSNVLGAPAMHMIVSHSTTVRRRRRFTSVSPTNACAEGAPRSEGTRVPKIAALGRSCEAPKLYVTMTTHRSISVYGRREILSHSQRSTLARVFSRCGLASAAHPVPR